MRVLVLSDTHIPDHARSLPAELISALSGADVILHAGDVTSIVVLETLAAFAPVHAALGNNDGADVRRWGARQVAEIEIGGVRIALIHDSGPSAGRARRMRRLFPDAQVVVFGHSHIPIDDRSDGIHLFNPGSPTWKRRQPLPTYGVLTVAGGHLSSRIVALPLR